MSARISDLGAVYAAQLDIARECSARRCAAPSDLIEWGIEPAERAARRGCDVAGEYVQLAKLAESARAERLHDLQRWAFELDHEGYGYGPGGDPYTRRDLRDWSMVCKRAAALLAELRPLALAEVREHERQARALRRALRMHGVP